MNPNNNNDSNNNSSNQSNHKKQLSKKQLAMLEMEEFHYVDPRKQLSPGFHFNSY